MWTYEVSVTTGSQLFSGSMNYIYLTLVGKDGSSDRTLLNKSFFDYFVRGTVNTFNVIVKENLGDIVLVKLEKERYCINDQWYCKHITVMTPSGNCFQFPCYRWLVDQKEVVLREGTARLPQDDENELTKEHRRAELEWRQKIFRWCKWCPGYPMSIDDSYKNLPQDVKFETDKTFDFGLKVIRAKLNAYINQMVEKFQSPWEGIADLKKINVIIKNAVPEYLMDNWNEDFLFGYQFLNGCNPVMIKKCEKLPAEKFPVTEEMVKGFLKRGLTLHEELEAGNIYIADYEILDGVPANTTDPNTPQYLAAPICLLYKNTQNQIVPIAIQLCQKPGEGNPIFLPSDNQYDWMLAKMWVRSCNFNVHQGLTHLLKTHLIAEVFTIAMYRHLPAVHPVYKLLIPHIRYTIAINTEARENLISAGGVFDKGNSISGSTLGDVVKKVMKTFTYKSLCFPEAIKDRGMDSKTDVPNYYYRDDGMMVWEAVKRFVSDVVKIYYKSDKTVQSDEEIQNFVKDVCFGMNYHCDFPKSLKTKKDLTEYLTVVIFTVSAQHAAVNFGQYDWYGWVPNGPSTMRKPPPTKKDQVDMKYIMESLPDRDRACKVLGTAWALSQFQENELFLGTYPDKYFTEQSVLNAMNTFRKELAKVTNTIKERNEKLPLPYWYLSPDKIPNSIAI
ncbi:polyunsaturated fatty acid 5-lipoxygenase-like [Myxocyprinus asiaticus]|uniref:polyunsaturated fatty acid 5-lipoxygenase-like n=1 Tax=Myxocyprinus asiaticus TaxID=70543 RepID=UPI002223BCFC|nr:polyunsaturated fatty acid 5-lipoxygenase-like [Myxocyprinus asiaticus]